MQLTLAHIGSQKGGKPTAAGLKRQYDALTRLYLERASSIVPCQDLAFATESAFLDWLARPGKAARTTVFPVLLDSRGRAWTSEELAAWLGTRRDQGTQHIAFAIGPADGWSPTALQMGQGKGGQCGLLLSFGAITMAHALARLVLAEQLYRACTILTGHPYHSSH